MLAVDNSQSYRRHNITLYVAGPKLLDSVCELFVSFSTFGDYLHVN